MSKKDFIKSADGLLVAYETAGTGEPALVFAHCWCGNRSYWKNQIDFFSKNYPVITLDLAGHGESGKTRKDYTVTAFAHDVIAVLKKVAPEKVILIGHSLGGPVMVAVSAMLGNKVLAVIGIDTFANIEFIITDKDYDIFIEPYRKDFKGTTEKYIKTMFHVDADQRLVEKISNDISSAFPEMAMSSFKELYQYNLTEDFRNLKHPVIAINTDKHPTNVEVAKQYTDSFELIILEDVGHFMMLEDPVRFNKVLDETIKKLIKNNNFKKGNDFLSGLRSKIFSIFR